MYLKRLILFLSFVFPLVFVWNWKTTPTFAASNDCDIWWNEVLHDTFNTDYRNPIGAVPTGTTVRLRLRVAQSDVTSIRVRVWDDRTNTETYYNMSWDGTFDTDPVTYDWWTVDIPVGSTPTILYYFFELNDAPGWCPPDQDFYVDDDPKFYGGGYGTMIDNYDDMRSFQITVYDPAFSVPSWMQRGVVYQIFPDRFRDGDSTNNPQAGRFSYNRTNGAIVRSNFNNANPGEVWNFTICDPRGTYSPSCVDSDGGYYGDNFYGGDLRGIIQKIEDGYFTNLGITALYLNPIFRSPSNHKYDTADYMTIDPDFGTLADFQELVQKAEARGIKVILDGVFNHTSSDSRYFDRYSRYDSSGNLTSPSGPGSDDNSGACESPNSPYRDWYYIPDIGTPGNKPDDRCDPDDTDDPGGPWNQTYETWYGYGSLPKLRADSSEVRNLIWANGTNSVGPYWISQGADGWRLDVGGDVDPGVTNDPANDYWEGFRAAVRAVKGDALIVGEEWGDASPWLLGNEWDSAMNYRLRSALLGWLMTGCTGNGCTGGTKFEDNDSNDWSASGAITPLSPSQFNARLLSIWEDYPPMAFKAMMNLEGSHDTNRIRFLLKMVNNDDDATAVQRMKEWFIFVFTYPGVPTLYYGDEIGLNQDGVWTGSRWEDDPYNRVPFPWPDASGSTYAYDSTAQSAGLLDHVRKMSSIRHSYRALQDGDVHHALVLDDGRKLYGFARTFETGGQTETALIVLNRDTTSHNVTINNLNNSPYNLADGTVLVDALNGGTFTVSGGSISVNVPSNWGGVLLEQNKIDTPQLPTGYTQYLGSGVKIAFTPVFTDTDGEYELVTTYEVYRDNSAGFTPGPSNRIASVVPAPFGGYTFSFQADPGMTVSFDGTYIVVYDPQGTTSHYYAICVSNGAGKRNCSSPSPTAVRLENITGATIVSTHKNIWFILLCAMLGMSLHLYRGTAQQQR